jgi:hypothetical protein
VRTPITLTLTTYMQVGANLNNLASLLQQRGHHERALENYERARSIFHSACGAESAEVGVVLCNMGSLHR